jgi:hypothetical protein
LFFETLRPADGNKSVAHASPPYVVLSRIPSPLPRAGRPQVLTVNTCAYGPLFGRWASPDAIVRPGGTMRYLLLLIAWCILFVLSWPIALLALVLWPIFWLLSLPFRLIGITFDALFALLKAILLLPARLFGYRARS